MNRTKLVYHVFSHGANHRWQKGIHCMASEKQKQTAWEHAKPISGKNPDLYRKDAYGNVIYKPSYGMQSNMGWEVDHKHPVSKGGSDSERNLQAVQWEENRVKGNKYPYKGKK